MEVGLAVQLAVTSAILTAMTITLSALALSAAFRWVVFLLLFVPIWAALQTFLQEKSTTPMASSRLKDYLPHLVPLILDAPHHAMR